MKASIYIRDDYKDKNNESSLFLRVFMNKKYFYIPLNFSCSTDDFDKEKGKVTRGPKKHLYNHIISDAMGAASKIFLKYQVNGLSLTREMFEKEFNSPEILTDFYAFMEHEIKIRKGDITLSSINQHMAILSKMKKFRPSLMLIELDENYLNEFKKHLKTKLKNKPNTVNNALKVIKVYVNKAIKMGLISKSPFLYLKIRREKSYPEFLTLEERNKLIKFYEEGFFEKNQHRVLRWFLFSCFTGLRIGDLRKVKHENIKNGILSLHPIKTQNVNNRKVEIPLTKYAKKLIKDENPHRISGLLFDCISEQKMNKNLQTMIEFAEINKEISFHNARHTFATLFLKSSKRANGILILQKLLGHSNIETTMVYSHVLNEDIVEAMADFDN